MRRLILAKTKLEIGDADAAIIQLQRMQSSYPLRSLVEIVENGIDAKSSKIDIVRCKHGGKVEIIVTDYGKGITAGSDGNSDMHRVRTHICDSEKIREKMEKRENLQGEFAIGMLGFAALAENLCIQSRTETSKLTRTMTLKAYSVDCDINSETSLIDIGTIVRMWPIREVLVPRLTGEKIANYLGSKLSDRIRETSVVITVYDKILKKTLNVKPMDFKGERIPVLELRLSGDRKLKLDLHATQQGEKGHVGLVRKGTVLVEDISEIDVLNHAPWNNPLLEGRIHNRFIRPTPNRADVVIDDDFQEFILTLKGIEDKIIKYLKDIEEKRNQKKNEKTHVQLKKEIGVLMSLLPPEYSGFNEKGRLTVSVEGIVDDKNTIALKNTQNNNGKKKKMVTLSAGPLSFLQISPNNYYAVFGETVKLQTTAWTMGGERVYNNGLKYDWKIRPSTMGETIIVGDTCSFIAGDETGTVEIEVNASLEFEGRNYTAKKYASIMVGRMSHNKFGKMGFLKPVPVDMPGESWRSRKTDVGIKYNMGHKDYKKAEENDKVLRYLLMLFSKHIILYNFSGEDEETILERMVEITTVLDNKNGKKKI